MEKTIEVSMVHDQDSPYTLNLILECMNLRAENDEAQSDDNPLCNICEERMVELAIRKEWSLLADAITAFELWEPKRSMEVM
jgi:hypothetical protein